MGENSQKSRDDSSHGSNTQAATADKVVPSSPTNDSKGQSAVSKFQDKDQLTSKDDSSSLHSLPTGTKTSPLPSPNSKPHISDVSKRVAARSNQVHPKQTRKSIISSAVPSSSPDTDGETTENSGK